MTVNRSARAFAIGIIGLLLANLLVQLAILSRMPPTLGQYRQDQQVERLPVVVSVSNR